MRGPMVRAAARYALLLGLLAPCACKGSSPPASGDGGAHAATDLLSAEEAAKVLARVGDKTITLGDYVAALEHMDQFDRMRYQSPERRKELLNEMINVELLAQEAHDKGYDKDPQTEQEVRAVLRDAMLRDARKSAPKPADISEDEVKAYFDAHRADYHDPERRRVSAIAVANDAAANAVIEQTKKGVTAAQWGELVHAKAIDGAAKENAPADLAGDLGIVGPPDDPRGANPNVPDAVRTAAFQIAKVGDILSTPVHAGGKVYVVRLAVKMDALDRTLEESERSIRVKLSQDKLRAKEDEMLAQLRTKFPVQIDDGVIGMVKVDLVDAGAAASGDAASD
jgi:peptidyl-prolyl cis-trans isomerase C